MLIADGVYNSVLLEELFGGLPARVGLAVGRQGISIDTGEYSHLLEERYVVTPAALCFGVDPAWRPGLSGLE
jgi:hypothetical protein